MIAGASGYSISYSESDPEYIALEHCDEGEPETERLALATRLFTSVGDGRFVPAHRHIAEFLGAWHLAHLVDGGLPIGRVLAMITAGDGSVVPVFRGLSAWLAAHCTGARSSLIESDPVGVGKYGDLQNFSTGDKRSLLWALNPEVASYGVDVLVLQRRLLNLVSYWPEIAPRKARPQSCQAHGQVAMKRPQGPFLSNRRCNTSITTTVQGGVSEDARRAARRFA